MPGTGGQEARRSQWNAYARTYGKPVLESPPSTELSSSGGVADSSSSSSSAGSSSGSSSSDSSDSSSSGSSSSDSSDSSSSGSSSSGSSPEAEAGVSWADRRALFRRTLRQITAMNAQNARTRQEEQKRSSGSSTASSSGSSLSTSATVGAGYRVGLNHMADWTAAEKAQLRGRLHSAASERTRTTADRTAKLGGLLRDFDVQMAVDAASNIAASASALKGEAGAAARQQQAAEQANLSRNQDGNGNDNSIANGGSSTSASSSTGGSANGVTSGSSSSTKNTATTSTVNGVAIEGHVLPSIPGHDVSLDVTQEQQDLLDVVLPEAVDWRGAYGKDPSSSSDGAPRAVVGPVKDQVRYTTRMVIIIIRYRLQRVERLKR